MLDKLKDICETIENKKIDNTYKLDCIGSFVCYPKNVDELSKLLTVIRDNNLKYIVLGNCSNVILPNYYDGIIIKLKYFNKSIITKNELYVESGYLINKLANELLNNSYSALEWAGGIPGSIGACIYNNAGAYNKSISDILISTTVLDTKTNKIIKLNNLDCKFNYRTSIFKEEKKYIILSCKLKIEKSNKEEIKKVMNDRMQKRIDTQPLDKPSCGSVFRNPENISAGKLIDDLNLKGTKIGDAKISEKHANFIINDGKAEQEDIIKLIEKIKKMVKEKYNIDLVLEQEIIK